MFATQNWSFFTFPNAFDGRFAKVIFLCKFSNNCSGDSSTEAYKSSSSREEVLSGLSLHAPLNSALINAGLAPDLIDAEFNENHAWASEYWHIEDWVISKLRNVTYVNKHYFEKD